MGQRAKDLADRLIAFNNDVIRFVENCSDRNWTKVCPEEDWRVGVVARHIGAGHYEAVELARSIIRGENVADFTMDRIIEAANAHAREHADCSREEVVKILRENGSSLADFVAGLNDSKMDRKGFVGALEGEISAEKFVEMVILQSGGEHLDSMKKTVGSG